MIAVGTAPAMDAAEMPGVAKASDIFAVRQKLADARDGQISRVVAMVDALPARGAADRLIAPLRPRLAQLRPDRPLQFGRLLFLPFDPVIVVAEDWTPGGPTVPRILLAPVAEAMRLALGELTATIEAMILGRTTADQAIITEAGRLLWPAAARAIAAIHDIPGEWSAHGLPRSMHSATATIAGVLAQAASIQELVARAPAGDPMPAASVLPILERGARHGAGCRAMLQALLLCRLPRPDELLRILALNGTAAAEQAIDAVLGAINRESANTAVLDNVDLNEAGAELTRLAGLLDGLEAGAHRAAAPGGERHSAIAGTRRRLEAACRSRFEAGLAGELMLPMLSLPADAGSAEIVKLEDTARQLRRIEICGRRLGGQEGYGRMLHATATEVRAMRGNGALTLADRVRMVEILAGPDEALAMLSAGG